jgi:hypothetical protein
MIRNQAGQVARLEVMSLAGAPFTGAVTAYVQVDTATQAIGSVGAGVMALQGNGVYLYLPSQAETNGASIEVTGIGAGAAPASKTYETITLAQAQALQTATGPGVRYVLGVIANALFGLNIYHANEPIKVADSTLALFWLNLIFDDWNLDPQASYAAPFTVFASTGANPETIGPSGTWVLPARPPAIQGVAVDLGSGLYREIFVTDDPAWWAARSPILTGSPGGAYYEASEPNGKLYFTSLPAAATNIRLLLRTTFGRVALTDVLVLPPGYESALTLTLMEAIAEPLHATVSASLATRAGKARALIFSKNLRVPALSLRGLGLPGVSRGWWDYRTGTWRS